MSVESTAEVRDQSSDASPTPHKRPWLLWGIIGVGGVTLAGMMTAQITNMARTDRDFYKPRVFVQKPVEQVVVSPEIAKAPHSGDASHGQSLFSSTCFACHGPKGDGVPNLGPTLRASKFVASTPDEKLVNFIKVGRMPGQPGSVMNGMMPAKGGNPALDDTALHDIVAFLREIQAGRADAGGSAAPALADLTPGR